MLQAFNPYNPNVTYRDYLDNQARFFLMIFSIIALITAYIMAPITYTAESYLFSTSSASDALSSCHAYGFPLMYPLILAFCSLVGLFDMHITFHLMFLAISTMLLYRSNIPTYLYAILTCGLLPFSIILTAPSDAGVGLLLLSLIVVMYPNKLKYRIPYSLVLGIALNAHPLMSLLALYLGCELCVEYLQTDRKKAAFSDMQFLIMLLFILGGLYIATNQLNSLQLSLDMQTLQALPMNGIVIALLAGIIGASFGAKRFKYIAFPLYGFFANGYCGPTDFAFLLCIVVLSTAFKNKDNDELAVNWYNGITFTEILLFTLVNKEAF